MKKIDEHKFNKFKSSYSTNKVVLNAIVKQVIHTADSATLKLIKHLPELQSCIDPETLTNSLQHLVTKDEKLNFVKQLINNLGNGLSSYNDHFKENLLDISVHHGALKITKYLISKGFDVDKVNARGESLIHTAVHSQNKEMVKLLINCKANLNKSINNTSLTPWKIAMLVKNEGIAQLLIKAGAKRDIGFMKSPKKYKIDDYKVIPLPASKPLDYIINISLIKGLFSPPDRQENFFNEALIQLKKQLDNLEHIKKNNLTAHYILENLFQAYSIYKPVNHEIFKNLIIIKASEWHDYENLACFYKDLCTQSCDNNDYETGRVLADLAYKTMQQASTIEDRLAYEILSTCGVAFENSDKAKALNFFDKAGKIKSGDQTTTTEKALFYIKKNDLPNALQEINNVNDLEYRKLLEIFANLETTYDFTKLEDIFNKFDSVKFNEENLKNRENLSKYKIYAEIKVQILSFRKDYAKAIKFFEESFPYLTGHTNRGKLFKLLSLCVESGLMDEGLEKILKYNQLYPEIFNDNSNIELKFFEFIIYEATEHRMEADKCLETLKSNSYLNDEAKMYLRDANLIRFYMLVTSNDYDSAIEFIKVAEPNKQGEFLAQLLNHQKKLNEPVKVELLPSEAVDEYVDKPSEAPSIDSLSSQMSFVNLDLISEEDMDDPLIALSQKEFHKYCQAKKKELLSKNTQKNGKIPQYSWSTQENKFTTKDPGVYKVENRENYYATIDPTLAENMEPLLLQQFTSAIEKGMVSKLNYSNGIRLIPHKLIELKINEDDRLVAEQIYYNNGKYLIAFNKPSDHTGVKKLAKGAKKLKIIETADAPFFAAEESLDSQTNYYDNFVLGESHAHDATPKIELAGKLIVDNES